MMMMTDRGELLGIQGFTRPHHSKVCHHPRGVMLEDVAMDQDTARRTAASLVPAGHKVNVSWDAGNERDQMD